MQKVLGCFILTLLTALLSGCFDGSSSNTSWSAAGTNSVTFAVKSLSDTSYYPSSIAGPAYTVISVRNNNNTTLTFSAVNLSTITGVSIDAYNSTDYGSFNQCVSSNSPSAGQVNSLAGGGECIIILHATANSPMAAATSGTLSINTMANGTASNKTYTVTDTSYLYVGGAFQQIGDSPTLGAGQYMLAQCTGTSTLSCTNALDATGGTNYANDYIMASSITPQGNLYLGGLFNTIGSTSVGTLGLEFLVAKCTPGGDCSNALGSSGSNSTNGEIHGMTIDSSTDSLYIGGAFTTLQGVTQTAGPMLTQCTIGSSSLTCSNALTAGVNKSANADIWGIASDNNGTVYTGGAFTQIANTVDVGANHGFLASCASGSCSNLLTGGTPYSQNGTSPASYFIQGTTLSNTTLYTVGQFNQIASATTNPINTGTLFAACDTGAGTCQNVFSTANVNANNNIDSVAVDPASSNSLYVGGSFSSLGGTSVPASGTRSLFALCTGAVGSKSCTNALGSSGTNYVDNTIYTTAIGPQLTVQ